ncbi:MAG: multidrug effflux MFS transporter [Rhodospirillaceae bacterium]|nr:multidrug effflux MFS transporter [Rhodospirillaceae bacterium]
MPIRAGPERNTAISSPAISSPATDGAAPPRIGVEFILLVALMMGITALSIDIMLPALPDIEAHYDLTDMNDQQLVIVSYMVGFGVGQLVFGPFSDRYGRKPVFYFGMAVYMAATVLAVVAFDFDTHLAGRLLQGVAAGAARVIAVAVVRDRFAGRAMARAMSFIMAIFILVPVVAPGIGAGILLIGPWQDIFWFLLGTAAILTLWTALRLKETRPQDARRPLTVRSFAGAAAAVLGNRQTLCYMATASLTFGPLLAYIATSHQIFVGIYRIDAWFPVAFGGIALFSIASAFVNARLVPRLGMRRMSHSALLIQLVLALAFAALAWAGQPSLILLLVFFGFSMFMVGLCFPNFNALAMEPHGAIAGTASSITGFVSTAIGSALGWAIGAAFDGTVMPLTLGFAACAGFSIVAVLVAEPGRFLKSTA